MVDPIKPVRPSPARWAKTTIRKWEQISVKPPLGQLAHYRGCRADQADLKKRMREIAETRVRYGYRRIHVLLRREGWDVNAKRVYRLYKELGLQLRHKPPERRVKAKPREGRGAASGSNEVWATDFAHDKLATGSKLRILTVIDTYRRFSPAVVPRFSFWAPDVIEVLDRVCGEVGHPASIRVDQGGEFVAPGPRPVCVCERGRAGLLAARHADGQCLHRKIQR
ncbi:transposase [Sphingomonas glacialis]|uniref:Transposase n=1 Tax=Sphingomonas glacialis TaxID=658225 RepID=A0A502FRP7_9SPHN|nr:transposase [Sphingomonas glacialis]